MRISVDDLLAHSFVLSCDGRSLERFYELFRKHGLNGRPEAYRGRMVDRAGGEYAVNRHYLAAHESHFDICELARKRGWPYVCVFEDDAHPCRNVLAKLERCLADVPDDALILKLGSVPYSGEGATPASSAPLERLTDGKYVRSYFGGSHAYVIFASFYEESARMKRRFDERLLPLAAVRPVHNPKDFTAEELKDTWYYEWIMTPNVYWHPAQARIYSTAECLFTQDAFLRPTEASARQFDLSGLAGAVTTVITTYNHEKFIAQALDSAIAQSGDFSHEILVSDDGSTDGTRAIVREYESRHPGLIKDISPASNLGISGNLRHCFGQATGKYVAILEGDDYWTDPEKIRKQVAWMELHPDCPMVFSRIRLNRDGEMSLLDRHERLPERVTLGDLIRCESMNPVCNFSCCLFRRDQLLKLPDVAYEGRLSEVTVAVFLAQVAPLGFLREVMSDYRIHGGGTFAGADKAHQCEQAVQTFLTTKKVIHWSCWPHMTRMIRRPEARLRQIRDRGAVRFSVVTVTRQNLEGLRRTAASVAAQTCRDFEWIVVDGGSVDGSREFLETLKPGTVRWISEPDNGVYDAMNKGIGLSSGTYLIFMNAGDVFHSPATLAEVDASAPTADVVYGDWIRRSSTSATRVRAPKTLPPFYFFRPACNICQQAMFVRGELLKADGFDAAYKVLGDLAKWRHCQMEGRSFEKVNVVVCDFEADVGLSERPSVQKVLDLVRLQSEFPPGLFEDAVRLGDYLRKHRLALSVSTCARRLAHWLLAPMRGILR